MTGIEWTDKTWNPIVGCSITSPGCTNCYAMKDAWRKNSNPKTPQYHGTVRKVNGKPVWTGTVNFVEHKLNEPLKIKKPHMFFVNSMSDLFHENVPNAWIDRVINVMERATQHTFQTLTKRSARMRQYLSGRYGNAPGPANMWFGVSVEDEARKFRIEDLRQAPAGVRFLSIEPLLAPVGELNLDGIHWIIVGGESGPRHRPFDPQWAREVRDQCEAANVAFFFKQWGGRTSKAGGCLLDGREWKNYPQMISARDTVSAV
jgi:protein gp37